ncbi:(2Fe-2S)-binding protein [Desulforamulus aeronauticus]|uniref:Carbon-monoxide dehydrogenase small subunit n=1 Tax=Desulforamulus aeronauticus DSM 10349 TaxID=1121421 RepID=A0A1M6UHB6_9FIRM|nr:(2Fe-2S)-binding protein [Desulforamulus aeronauticus]SHK68488.1 carbon-monoxide dehydrogenase small subunit [Desulforamulus aeronauticus DSM 10349]
MAVYTFTLNGKQTSVEVPSDTTLLETLREALGLTGTKEGCGKGECGACTVIVNGKAANACLIMTSQLAGADIRTIEGLGSDGVLDSLQTAFVETGAVQCGYCTPGMLMSARALLLKKSSPSTEEIRESIAGNLCRCTGYAKIVEAIRKAAVSARERGV